MVHNLAISAVDPLNLAATLVPGYGEARWAMLLGRAASPFLRAGIRLGWGAERGLVGTAALQPLEWGLSRWEQTDFTLADALRNTLSGAVRRLSALPAENFKLRDRGHIRLGNFADIVVFDPATIADHATYDDPRELATGVRDVFVNGVAIVRDGVSTGARPGRFVQGPGAPDAAP